MSISIWDMIFRNDQPACDNNRMFVAMTGQSSFFGAFVPADELFPNTHYTDHKPKNKKLWNVNSHADVAGILVLTHLTCMLSFNH